jgi:tRNA(adenine34) deaminase
MAADEQYMELAIEQGKEAKADGEWPFGAVIVQDGEVVAKNRRREAKLKTVLGHAELLAVDDACKALGRTNLSDCTIYTTNEPCLMCAAAIFQAKIPRIVIGASRADIRHLVRERNFHIENLAEDSGYKPEMVRGVLRDEVLALFADVHK